ncbi:hypothetical protein D4764_22G0006230 [Takifugu flavidus]|uniref:Uncharacterized protein n=1 Tax=Takifugu flavidus TaxID=433684 RepID=A0A5C6ND56_9TELE|nr:hypothetical protein D4764_22G0006230 [Takifugu flavidus]
MAVKGETDPAARAHIHPTSSRKPAVVEATLRVGVAPKKILSSSSSSRDGYVALPGGEEGNTLGPGFLMMFPDLFLALEEGRNGEQKPHGGQNIGGDLIVGGGFKTPS